MDAEPIKFQLTAVPHFLECSLAFKPFMSRPQARVKDRSASYQMWCFVAYILSFHERKWAVWTSNLSTRWKNVCVSTPI